MNQEKQEMKLNYKYQLENKKYGRGPSYQYVCRMLTKGNKTGDNYGITIPRELVEKYDLLGKKFNVEVKKKGIIMIKTKIEYEEIK